MGKRTPAMKDLIARCVIVGVPERFHAPMLTVADLEREADHDDRIGQHRSRPAVNY